MRNILVQLNDFFSSTSIHGFSYITDNENNSRSTRIIWAAIVIFALFGASYLLYQTVYGFDHHVVDTAVESRSIKNYPFPAITFHPGDYNSKEAFLRTFLNQLEFTRYDEQSPLRDDEEFLKTFLWLVGPMHNDLLDDIETFLLYEYEKNNGSSRSFLESRRGIFKKEVCFLVALQIEKISLK